MNILWIKANKLFPLHSGGDIRSFHILKQLSARHRVTFVSYYDGVKDQRYETELKSYFPTSISIATGKSPLRALDYLRNLPYAAPYAVGRFASSRVQEKLRSLLEGGNFDVVVCDFLDAAINLPGDLKTPAVLFQHNVESEIWRRHAATEVNPAKRIMYRLESKKMLEYEAAAVRRFQHVIAVSDHDRSLMQKWINGSRITVVPTGVDVAQYRQPCSEQRGLTVTFTGAMDWEPNIDAIEFFCDEIWDSVIARVPEAKFCIVGRNPRRRVQNLASGSIEVTGSVPSVLDYLRSATVVVVPLRIAGGTRLKIYEAMAAGKAVVSTSVGAEGLDVHDRLDIQIADDPGKFADSVVALLQDAGLRKRYEHAAYETAGKYDWSLIAGKFSDALESIVQMPVAGSEEI